MAKDVIAKLNNVPRMVGQELSPSLDTLLRSSDDLPVPVRKAVVKRLREVARHFEEAASHFDPPKGTP
jgi:hypothetical protein